MLEEPQTVLLFVFENVQVVRVPVEMVAVAADGGTTLLPFVVCFVVFAADEIAATGEASETIDFDFNDDFRSVNAAHTLLLRCKRS